MRRPWQIPSDDEGYFPQQQFDTFLVAFDVLWQVRSSRRQRPHALFFWLFGSLIRKPAAKKNALAPSV